ncbi:hypothetical protein BGW36DRAFT_45220 [Talaromyces proteolyticus]|uniref:DUF7357 domain-containing protein n=1 Tax=Talaromyces proteolyticus TaxID=1131652 RepID=A0AAD4KP87_9EURO|nr:uncharacterized protein BGW36DRAFT_45220 [Talaromyces proteolyticus]KAH8692390.1 hypothetical protein BGW36DRAFT_45220 [Talaromyces proteolyticus]
MRLRLVIIRHGLPAARILWTVPLGQGSHPVSSSELTSNITPNAAYGQGTCTIAQLLEDVNEVVPLETAAGELGENDEFGGQWGLEDYVVEVNHFECLHFMDIGGLLRDGDEVVIRALGLSDLRARRLSGRVQISSDGRRLIDGVSFGRPFLKRSFSSRPPIRIPPRKRRRTTFAGWAGNAQQDDYDEEVDTTQGVIGNELTVYEDVSEQGTVIRHSPKLYDDANDSENDDDSSSSVDYSEDEDLAEELKVLRDEADENSPPDQIDTESPRMTRSSGRVSRMTYRLPIPTSSPERPSEATPSRFTNSTAGVEPSPKSTKSVRFGLVNIKDSARTDDLLPPDSEDESYESDDESVAESSSSETSNVDSSVENTQDDALSNMEADSSDSSTSDESSVSEETDSESESESDSPSLMEEPEQTVVYTAPGRGSTKTKNSNRRKKLRTRLKKLKELGHLPAEANFEDLQKWELDHGKIPLMEVTDLEKPRSSQARQEQSEFEKRRQQLLRDLASGGIDVDAHSEKENIPPKSKNGRDSTTNTPKQVEAGGPADKSVEMVDASIVDEGDEEGEPSPSSNKRRKLDISSTKRLLFGSLGVRTPKTKEDEERTRNKLAGPRKEIQESNGKKPTVLEEGIESDHEDNWQSKVILAATECIFNDVELIPPPFPFQQRWDADAVSTIRQLKGSKNKRSKKKRKSQDYHEEEYYEEYYDDAGYLGDATEDYANGDITLNYDDEPSTLHEHTMETYTNGEDVGDLPQLPEDLNSVPNLSQGEAVAGAIIAFMQLDMSKATNWQPRVSGYRVGRIDFVLGDGSLSIQLAKRDREKRETVIDEDGVREYSGFEMPDDEEEQAVEDDGFRSLSFDELLEPKLLQPANQEKAASVVDGSQEPSLSVGKFPFSSSSL